MNGLQNVFTFCIVAFSAGVCVLSCADECKDGDFLECYQCDSLTHDGCQENVTLDDSYVILCPEDSFRCVFEYSLIDEITIYRRDCQLKEGDAYWHNTSDTHTHYCDTDRCNFSASGTPAIRSHVMVTWAASVMAVLALLNI